MYKVFLLSLLISLISYSMQLNDEKIISLNGEWEFTIDPKGNFNIDNMNEAEWRISKVPLSIQAQFEDLRDYQGVSWFRKNFTLSDVKNNKIVLLKFNAVDYLSEVFVNKKFVGKHEGGYTPFQFDISGFLREGSNEILVRVVDPVINETGTEGISYQHIPHGKQNWYVQTSGIWQDVNILIKPELFIEKIFLTPKIDGSIKIALTLNKPVKEEKIKIKIIDPSGNEALSRIKEIKEKKDFDFFEQIYNPELWHFDYPNLYTIEIALGEDKVSDRFGFRSIEAKNKKLYLNGEPFYLIAALDQDFYPETIYTTPSEDYLRDEMLKAKKLGLNMLRCHIKTPDPLYLKVADELGLLVWYEIPNWDVFSFEAADRGSKTIDEMLERDWNHPSLVVVSIINESWGIDLKNEAQRNWLLKEFERLKSKAEGRLIVDNSPCWGNFHIKTDINDYHTYWSIPDNKEDFDKTINNFSLRPKWLFSEFGDSKETGEEPLIISEFGNWGLPKLQEKNPWWFERKFFDIDISLPKGFNERFNSFKYDKVFGSYNNLAEECQRAQFNALKYEIETIRLYPEIQGYVITEFTDINWECNGLLDMWRNFKVYADELQLIQQQDIIIPRPVKYNYWNNEEVEIKIFISHCSDYSFNNLKLKWKNNLGDSGEIEIPFIKQSEVEELPILKFNLKVREISGKVRIDFELIDSKEKSVARNFTEVFVYNENVVTKDSKISVYDPYDLLNQFKSELKKDLTLSEESTITVTNLFDEKILERLHEGGSVICFVDSNTVLPSSSPLKILSRKEEWYDGNWASNFNWLKKNNELFNGVSFSEIFGFETSQSSPEWVIINIPEEKFSNVLAGMFVGWIHLSSGYIVEMQSGKGQIILCSFPIIKNYSKDPFAKKLFYNLINYIKNNKFDSL